MFTDTDRQTTARLVYHKLTMNLRLRLAKQKNSGGGVAQWLGRRISDQGVPGSNSGQCTFRCGLEQVTFTLLSTG